MTDISEIGLDSQCLSYLINALDGIAAPTDGLAEQKVALVRLYLYTPGTLWVTQTVEREVLRIREEARRASHLSWTNTLFGVRPCTNATRVEQRVAELAPRHSDIDDRMVLSEAEDIGLSALLSFDAKFVKHLAPHALLLLTRPAAYWDRLGIPRGASPTKLPTYDNPLAQQDWWRW